MIKTLNCLECKKKLEINKYHPHKKFCCKKCQKSRHYKDNKKRIRKQAKENYYNNPKKANERNRKYYQKNKGEILRKEKEYRAKDYLNNPQKYNDIVKKRVEAKRKMHSNYKKNKSCVKCGYNKVVVILEYHHRNPKEKEKNVCGISTLKAFLKEVKKCDLLCPNCHRLIHLSTLN